MVSCRSGDSVSPHSNRCHPERSEGSLQFGLSATASEQLRGTSAGMKNGEWTPSPGPLRLMKTPERDTLPQGT